MKVCCSSALKVLGSEKSYWNIEGGLWSFDDGGIALLPTCGLDDLISDEIICLPLLSCPVSGAYSAVIENGNSSRSRVSVKIFSFVPLNVIYLHCEIQICVETGSGSCKPVRVFGEIIL